MAKLGCAKCGGKVKMATGGAMPKVLAKANTQLYGIPQENMGTSSQYCFGRKGGMVKKMKLGGDPGDKLKQFISSTQNKVKQTVKNVVRQVKDNSQQRKIKKALPKYPAIKEGLQENVQVSESKYGGRVKKK